MKNLKELLEAQTRKLQKALYYLDYSYKKINSLPDEVAKLDVESLETWESFSARFGRVADMFLSKYLRTKVLLNDPGFSGSLRDFVNQGEKLGVIDNADAWMGIRELRNLASHDYTESDLTIFFKQLKKECPRLLAIKQLVEPSS